MTKKSLEKAPLVLVQAQIHFSALPSRELASEQELENLHKAMIELGFVERINTDVVEIGFQFNPEEAKDGYVELKQQKSNSKRLIFRGFGKTQSVELISNRLTVKCSQYESYEDYSDTIRKILEVLSYNLQDLQNVLTKQVSIRYIDVILPSKEHDLADYLVDGLLPYSPEFSDETSGISQSIAKTGDNQFMIIMAEEVKASQSGFPGRWLPADILESDQRAILVLNPYLENYQTGKNYGILNIDHRIDLTDTPKWKINTIMQKMDGLYDLSSQLFWEVISKSAKKEWGVKGE